MRMVGWMIALGIIALGLGLLSVPLVVRAHYGEGFTANARWLFFRIPLVPQPEKKSGKKKKEKPRSEKKEKSNEQEKKEAGVFARFYKYQGVTGYIDLLRRAVAFLKQFGGGFNRCVKLYEFALHMVIVGEDPAALSEQYGKLCAALFPSLGWLSSHLRHRRSFCRRIDVHPDFTGWEAKQFECGAVFSVSPLRLLQALLLLALRLFFGVVLRFLRGAKPPVSMTPKKSL
jgi:hypothetical protein